MKKFTPIRRLAVIVLCFVMCQQAIAQGTWTPLTHQMPDYMGGVALLLTDGTVIVRACNGGVDTVGDVWDKLTPDTNGSYANGTWSRIANGNDTRLFCSSQILKDGRVYVAGGEYGTGKSTGETYNPITNVWKRAGPLPQLPDQILDGNSELLPDGRVLQNVVLPTSIDNVIFDPVTDSYSRARLCRGQADEASWLKLPDNSILFVAIGSTASERFIPALEAWIPDATVPVDFYDVFGYEAGAAFLLPDGRGFFLGSTPTSAYYTPSGDTARGTWAPGPAIPDSLGAVDAAAAMMPNGKILCTFSKQANDSVEFLLPCWFYEFDYRSNAFSEVPAPIGGDTMNIRCSNTGMLDLPDGNILLTVQNSNQLYIYKPGGVPVASGVPVVDSVMMISCDTFMAVGKGFNGISHGAAYGDDWQMATNYPVIRLVFHDPLNGDFVHYARTFNWNSTGVMRGNAEDTTYFTLPAGLQYDPYDLVVVANGIPSAAFPFTPCYYAGVPEVPKADQFVNVYPNPATGQATVVFASEANGAYSLRLIDVMGRTTRMESGNSVSGTTKHVLNLEGLAKGVYTIVLQQEGSVNTTKLVVE